VVPVDGQGGRCVVDSGEAAVRHHIDLSGEADAGMARARAAFSVIFVVVIVALALLCASST